ncbi:MAG: hypothetical protein AB1705_11920, partial [Verrucomicrobiota bacterium]
MIPTRISEPVPVEAADPRAQWWRCSFERSEDAQLVCRDNGEMVESNRRARELFGLSVPHRTCLFDVFTHKVGENLRQLLQRHRPHPETLSGVVLLTQGRLTLFADVIVAPLEGGFFLV